MAKAFKCDGCTKLAEGKPHSLILIPPEAEVRNIVVRQDEVTVRTAGHYRVDNLDLRWSQLCPQCIKRLFEFIASLKPEVAANEAEDGC